MRAAQEARVIFDLPLHPIVVHFPLVLLLTGLAFEIAAAFSGRDWLTRSALVLLLLGVASAAGAVWSGKEAKETVLRTPGIESTLEAHETYGEVTLVGFLAVAAARSIAAARGGMSRAWVRWTFVLVWAFAASILVRTAYHGGSLVFHHGAGVTAGEGR